MTSIYNKPMGFNPFQPQTGFPGANRPLTRGEAQMVRTAHMQTQLNVNINMFMNAFQSMGTLRDICGPRQSPCFPRPPMPADQGHPQGSLKTNPEGVVTTPGGYKIEQLKQYDWKITGPDGKETKIWGDPHVAEGDGGKWDFKRDSTFVLGDGTRINATTKPHGKNASVTGGLEIISGNDRVQVTDIEKGKGKTGPVTQDGFAHANSFGGKDVFVMGRETDDWSFQGREVVGSNNLGESFVLGNALPAGRTPGDGMMNILPFPNDPGLQAGAAGMPGGAQGILPGEPAPGRQPNPFADQLRSMFQSLMQQFQSMMPFSDMLSQRNFGNPLSAPGHEGNWMDRRQQHLGRGFDDIGMMMGMFSQMNALSRNVQSFRNGFIA
jgi:hypothetical protein